MKIPHSYITFLLLFVGSILTAQEYTQYTEKDGLIGNYVYRGLQDSTGFIWLITEKGMSKFDGKTFKNFTTKEGLPSNDIWHIRLTPDNRVWFFTRSDYLGYIENDSVYVFPSSNGEMMNPNGKIFQAGNKIAVISDDHTYQFKDSVWMATKNNTSLHYVLNSDIKLRSDDKKHQYLEDSAGNILLDFKYDGTVNAYQFSDAIIAFKSDNAYKIINLENKHITSGAIKMNKADSLSSYYHSFSKINNELQFSSLNQLLTFNQLQQEEKMYHIPPSLNSTMSFEDRYGFIWACTSYDGVFKLPIGYQNFKHFLKGKIVSKLSEIDGVVYAGVDDDAIYTIDDDMATEWSKVTSTVFNIVKTKDATVAILRNHLHVLKEGSLNIIPTRPAFGTGKNLIPFNNAIFSEGFSGVSTIDWDLRNEKAYTQHSSYQGLFKQQDSLFIFNFKNMLQFDISSDQFISYNNTEIGGKVIVAETHQDKTYIATEGDGLYVFHFGRLEKLVALDRSVITNLSIENHNSIWAVSEGILLHYFRSNNEPFSVKKYSQINGYPTNNVIDVLIFNKELYIASSAGLTVIHTNDIVLETYFQPYVKAVSAAGKKLNKDSLNLRYDSNLNLKIDFGAINFFDSKNDEYQYRLSPEQDEWTTTTSGEVNFYNLKPNDYDLLLKVKQNATEKIIHLPITIRPLWWQRGSTKAIAIFLALCLTGLLLYLIRKSEIAKKTNHLITQKKIAEYELYALRSQMNPHFVFNSLAAIQYYINENDFVTSDKYLVKFSKLVRQFFELSKQDEMSLAHEIDLLKNYLEIEKMRFKDQLNFTITVDPNIDVQKTMIPTMLLQPVVENAVNHGIFNKEGKGTVSLNFKLFPDNRLGIEIFDDGVGMSNTKKKSTGKINSSMILKDRISVLNTSQKWNIQFETTEAFPKRKDRGNISTFTIEKLQ